MTEHSTNRGAHRTRVAPDGESPPQRVELAIPARAEWVRVVRLVTVGVANRIGFTYDDIEDLKLAVAEACNNAILHARPHDASAENESTVRVVHVVRDDRLEILVTDEGRTAEVKLPAPVARADLEAVPSSQLPEGGLGLLLMRSLMDEVQQMPDSEAHTLRLVKYLSSSR